MAEFKEELVINALHTDKAVIGKKYWYSDNIFELKRHVEKNDERYNGELVNIAEHYYDYPFIFDNNDYSLNFIIQELMKILRQFKILEMKFVQLMKKRNVSRNWFARIIQWVLIIRQSTKYFQI